MPFRTSYHLILWAFEISPLPRFYDELDFCALLNVGVMPVVA